MKNAYFFIVLLFITYSCTKKESAQISDKEDLVTITGKIENYNSSKWPDEGTCVLPNYLKGQRPEIKFPIDSLGNYELSLMIDRPTDLFIYNGSNMELLVQPGDKIYLEINAKDSLTKKLKTAKVKGSHALRNKQFLAYQSELSPDWEEYQKRIILEKAMVFKTYLDSVSIAKEKIIDRYIKEPGTDALLKDWLRAEKIVNSKESILKYGMMYGMYNQKQADIPDSFYQGLEPIGKINEAMLVNTNLSSEFGKNYWEYIRQIALNKAEKPIETWEEIYPIMNAEIIERNKDNKLFAQLVINNQAAISFENNDLKYYESIVPFKDSLFGNSQMGIHLGERYMEVKELLENPTLPEKAQLLAFNSESSADYLQEIIDNAQGKVIYIDNWATWCGPCKYEFKYSTPKLKEQFKDQVEFVYLCYNSEKEKYKPTIAQYNIEGKHYLIDRDEERELKEELKIQGFPTYAIINKKGAIVQSSSEYRSSESITAEILKELIAE